MLPAVGVNNKFTAGQTCPQGADPPTALTHLINVLPSLGVVCVEQLCLRVVSELDQLEGEVEWLVVVSSGQFSRA